MWFAWKFLSLWYQTQHLYLNPCSSRCCDLLENFYLCGIKHNQMDTVSYLCIVVICLKISIFVVSNTTDALAELIHILLWFAWKFLSLWYQTQPQIHQSHIAMGCDLLENFYLCGIKHNEQRQSHLNTWLWFAWKFLSLWYQTQLFVCCFAFMIGCDLLENFYLCGIKHNPKQEKKLTKQLWFAWKFLSLWYQTQHHF